MKVKRSKEDKSKYDKFRVTTKKKKRLKYNGPYGFVYTKERLEDEKRFKEKNNNRS